MNPSTARLFALGTGFLALVSVFVAALMAMRTQRLHDEVMRLRHDDSCPVAAAPTRSP